MGRNGSGKSTLLRAIAEKLIPGIPEQTRVSILQQTNATLADTDVLAPEAAVSEDRGESSRGRSVLEEVIEKATSRSEVEQEIRGEESPLPPPQWQRSMPLFEANYPSTKLYRRASGRRTPTALSGRSEKCGTRGCRRNCSGRTRMPG